MKFIDIICMMYSYLIIIDVFNLLDLQGSVRNQKLELIRLLVLFILLWLNPIFETQFIMTMIVALSYCVLQKGTIHVIHLVRLFLYFSIEYSVVIMINGSLFPTICEFFGIPHDMYSYLPLLHVLLNACFYCLLILLQKYHKYITIDYHKLFGGFIFAIVIVLLMFIDTIAINFDVTLNLVLLLFIICIFFYIIVLFFRKMMELDIYHKQIILKSHSYSNNHQDGYYMINQEVLHDLHRQIFQLSKLVQQRTYDQELETIVNGLHVDVQLHTGNYVLDEVLQNQIQRMKKHHITFHHLIENNLTFVHNQDLFFIFHTLFDQIINSLKNTPDAYMNLSITNCPFGTKIQLQSPYVESADMKFNMDHIQLILNSYLGAIEYKNDNQIHSYTIIISNERSI